MSKFKEQALKVHLGGKMEIASKIELETKEDLSLAYTPGVAIPCLEIHNNPELAYKYTTKQNTIAVVTDGSAVLGLGNIGPMAAMPVMEGKCLLFKKFAGVDAIPICLDTQDPDEIVNIVKNLAPTFGGVNLEDISFPRCVEIESRLNEILDIPVFHDDQRGTAIVTAAALINASRLIKKDLGELKVVINGFGAAGSSIAKQLKLMGVGTIYALNRAGIISKSKVLPKEIANMLEAGVIDSFTIEEDDSLTAVLKDADVFIGVSVRDVLTKEMINLMNDKPVVFALANPDPEIKYEEAKKSKAYIIATGRSDYPNQINNVLAFPGIFRGALDARVSKITDAMCVNASYAIADLIKDELTQEYIIPSVFDKRVVDSVSNAIKNTGE